MIDTLLENDTIVVDLFGKVKNGTFAGDNLGNAIFARSRTGMVIDGGIRDLDGIYSLPDFATFVRGVDPSAIADVTLTGIKSRSASVKRQCYRGISCSGDVRASFLFHRHLAQGGR